MNTDPTKARKLISWKSAAGGALAAAAAGLVYLEPALAKSAGELGAHVAGQGEGLGNAFSAMMYVGGMAAGGIAALKLKANRDSPQQTPLSHFFVALGVCALLLFLPQTFKTAGDTLFGNNATPNAIGGTTIIGN